MTRRDLFRGLFGRRPTPAGGGRQPTEAPAVVDSNLTRGTDAPRPPGPPRFGRGRPLPVLRPPGAVEETAFLAACSKCNACVGACPHGAIAPAPERFRGAAGTPVLNPAESPCRMCDGLPCVAACEPLALRFDVPAKMGTAAISPFDCLAHRGTTCSACVEQCPVEGAMRWENGRPVVDPAACTGCGVCQYVCPAPRNAVIILPTPTRPEPPEVPHDRRR